MPLQPLVGDHSPNLARVFGAVAAGAGCAFAACLQRPIAVAAFTAICPLMRSGHTVPVGSAYKPESRPATAAALLWQSLGGRPVSPESSDRA